MSSDESFSKTVEKKTKKSRSEQYSANEKKTSGKNKIRFSEIDDQISEEMDDFVNKQEEANERHLDYFNDYEENDADYDFDRNQNKKKNHHRHSSRKDNYNSGNQYKNFRKEDSSYNSRNNSHNGNKNSEWKRRFERNNHGMVYNKMKYN
jgi:hypothetical protein